MRSVCCLYAIVSFDSRELKRLFQSTNSWLTVSSYESATKSGCDEISSAKDTLHLILYSYRIADRTNQQKNHRKSVDEKTQDVL
jgi:hypothetical protein